MMYEEQSPNPLSGEAGIHAASPSSLRLLSWTGETGKRCYLSSDSDSSLLSRVADEMEEFQTDTAEEVLDDARAVLDDDCAETRELRFALRRTIESLRNVLLVAESRGYRLPGPDAVAEDEDGSHLPAESFE